MSTKIVLNGYDLSNFQLKKFIKKDELNIITKYDFSFDEADIDVPFETRELLRQNVVDAIDIFENGVHIYTGYLESKVLDFATKIMSIKSVPFLDLFSKLERSYAQTTAVNVMKQLYDILFVELPEQYELEEMFRKATALEGLDFIIDTDGDTTNVMKLLLDICEWFDVALYFKGLTLKSKIVENFPATAIDVTSLLVKKPVISELVEEFYNKITVEYKNSVGGADKSVSSGSGDIELKIDLSDIYVTDAVAQLIADRKRSVRQKFYNESKFEINNGHLFKVGDYVSFDNYIFLITSLQEEELTTSLEVIGVEAT